MTWSASGYEAVAQLVRQRTGLALSSRHDSVEGGIHRAMGRARLTDLDHYLDRIAGESNALDDLVVELTVGETYFFREPRQFEFLRREVLPACRTRCEKGHVLRIWSAGCASGEEAYSLAILLEQEGLADRAHILGTDISRAALARAQRAVYGSWSLRGENQLAALPYLTCSGTRYTLVERIRQRVAFDYLNLSLDVYPSPMTGVWGMDVILCRNVLIYFDRETIHRVTQKLWASLGDEGWLLTAASDPPLAEHAPLEATITTDGVFYRKRCAPPVTPVEVKEAPPPVLLDWEVLEEPEADALDRGDGAPVVEPARGGMGDVMDDVMAAVLHVRVLANLESADAERTCASAVERHRLSTELHYLHAVLLLDLGRAEEAIQAIRRVIYLDRSLALAHFTLAAILKRQGDRAGARRAYRNARDLCDARLPDERVPLAEGETAGRLAEAAAAQIALLDAYEGVS